MNKAIQPINISVLGGWGTRDFNVSAGVVDAGGLVIQVQVSKCHICERPLKVGDAVAVVSFDDPEKSERVYHIDCLPNDFGFAPIGQATVEGVSA